jgi:hypothetical protein
LPDAAGKRTGRFIIAAPETPDISTLSGFVMRPIDRYRRGLEKR